MAKRPRVSIHSLSARLRPTPSVSIHVPCTIAVSSPTPHIRLDAFAFVARFLLAASYSPRRRSTWREARLLPAEAAARLPRRPGVRPGAAPRAAARLSPARRASSSPPPSRARLRALLSIQGEENPPVCPGSGSFFSTGDGKEEPRGSERHTQAVEGEAWDGWTVVYI